MGEAEEAAVAVDTILHAIITFRNHCVEQFGDYLTIDTRTHLPCMTRMPCMFGLHVALRV